jgi:hypothetical protein
MFENKDMSRVFGPKRELHNFYSSPNVVKSDQIKENELGMACNEHRRTRKCTQY